MYNMIWDIEIGGYKLGLLESVEIYKSVDLLADIAVIKVPGVAYNQSLDLEEEKVKTGGILVGSFSGNYENLFILSAEVIDKIEITCNGQNVMQLLSDCLKTLAEAKIIVGNSTGTFEPSVISKLNQIENPFKQIFK
jgi:hypothetical protein